MSQPKHPLQMSRRGFLGTLGVVAGTLVAGAPAVGQAGTRALVTTSFGTRVGLVFPEGAGAGLAAGLQLGFDEAAARTRGTVDWTAQSAGPGALDTVSRSLDLISAQKTSLVVGVANAHMAAELSPTLARYGAFFVAVDGGASLARPSEQSPHILRSSLGYWQSSWAMGLWAAEQMGRKACVVSSFVESGYDALYAFERGFAAGGGEVLQTTITHVPNRDVDWTAVMTGIDSAQPDFVYAMYSGAQAAEFLRAYGASGLAGRIPLAGSAPLVDESVLAEAGSAAVGVRSCHTWAPGLATSANLAFTAAYRAMAGTEPDSLAVLGYDTAQLVTESLNAAGGGAMTPARLRQALAAVRLPSPRGALRVNPATNGVMAPLYVREVRRTEAGVKNDVVATLAPVDEADERLAPLHGGLRTGWMHAYFG